MNNLRGRKRQCPAVSWRPGDWRLRRQFVNKKAAALFLSLPPPNLCTLPPSLATSAPYLPPSQPLHLTSQSRNLCTLPPNLATSAPYLPTSQPLHLTSQPRSLCILPCTEAQEASPAANRPGITVSGLSFVICTTSPDNEQTRVRACGMKGVSE
jgi:hypothetical protein